MTARRRPWGLRLLMALPVAAAIPLAAFQTREALLPAQVGPWPASSRPLVVLGSLAGLPIVIFAGAAASSLFRRGWRRRLGLLGLTIAASAVVGAAWIGWDPRRMPAIEHYEKADGWLVLLPGMYAAGVLLLLGAPFLPIFRRIRRARSRPPAPRLTRSPPGLRWRTADERGTVAGSGVGPRKTESVGQPPSAGKRQPRAAGPHSAAPHSEPPRTAIEAMMDAPSNPVPPSPPADRTAVLLIAHGSREPSANDDLHGLAERLADSGPHAVVVACFLELAEPDIPTGGERCVAQGATRVLMVPYFLSAGVHLRRDLTAAREDLERRFPGVEFRLGPALGPHPLLDALVAARVGELDGDGSSSDLARDRGFA